MSAIRNGTGRGGWLQSGGRAGKQNADASTSLRWQRDCLMVRIGYSLGNMQSKTQLWLGVEDGTWLARRGYGLWWE